MEIIEIKPRGYCKGVVKSLALAKKVRKENPTVPITILGALVHNKYISQALESLNIKTIHCPSLSKLEQLEMIESGIVVFSAHGIAKEVIEKAQSQGLTVVDATCVDVTKTHQCIEKYLQQDYQVIYIGKKFHPETEAILSNYDVHFIETDNDVSKLNINSDKIVVTNQTTLSILQIQSIYDSLLKRYPQIEIENDICLATTIRQEAVIKNQDLDALVVVGDPMSNNTAMLASIGKNSGIPLVQRIETLQDLDLSDFREDMRIGVTAGASTPPYLCWQVINYLKELDINSPTPFDPVDLSKILD